MISMDGRRSREERDLMAEDSNSDARNSDTGTSGSGQASADDRWVWMIGLGLAFGGMLGITLGALIFDDAGIGSAVGVFIGIVAVTIIEWRRRSGSSVGPHD
jgi:hypothetical protein